MQCDSLLRNSSPRQSIIISKPSPAAKFNNDCEFTTEQRAKTIAMMRVNHTGEICAQALYHGQALFAKSPQQYNALIQAAAEENDHLIWCHTRITELNGRGSLLNPLWYVGSYAIGAVVGIMGDRISLGFIVETERQVTLHLERHLQRLNIDDHKTRAILQQMRLDEMQHATNAQISGAQELPPLIKILMRCTAKIMTVTVAKI